MISVITQNDLDLHKKWISGEKGGVKLVTNMGKIEICADLSGANLSRADLSCANLSGADLSGADLSRADLSGANLSGAKNTEYVEAITSILPAGTLIGYKKSTCGDCREVILTIEIPDEARRSNATGRKCRAEYAILKAIEGIGWEYDGSPVHTKYNSDFIYPAIGERITPDKWDDNRWAECSHGVHFFITRYEAEHYQ